MKTQKRPPRRKKAGFTLIEIMVVVLIIGLLVSLIGPNIYNQLIRSKKRVAEFQIKSLQTSIEFYRLQLQRLPDSLEELTQPAEDTGKPYMDSIPMDPWGNEYEYNQLSDGTYEIISYGGDGVPGGEGENADISSNLDKES
ncbi:MAG: type II secretion system major pseudopilin GspG [Planctomycetota bacterium]